jgi:hypothetical protein
MKAEFRETEELGLIDDLRNYKGPAVDTAAVARNAGSARREFVSALFIQSQLMQAQTERKKVLEVWNRSYHAACERGLSSPINIIYQR